MSRTKQSRMMIARYAGNAEDSLAEISTLRAVWPVTYVSSPYSFCPFATSVRIPLMRCVVAGSFGPVFGVTVTRKTSF